MEECVGGFFGALSPAYTAPPELEEGGEEWEDYGDGDEDVVFWGDEEIPPEDIDDGEW